MTSNITALSFPSAPHSPRPNQNDRAIPRFSRRFIGALLLVSPTATSLAFSTAEAPRHQQGMLAEPLSFTENSPDSQSTPSRQKFAESSKLRSQSHNSATVASTLKSAPMSIAGSWRKDKQNSDMERAATILMDGVSIKQDDEGFTTSFITKIRFFRPVESFSYTEPRRMPRRDQRRGCQTAVVSPTTSDRLEVNVTWDEPLQGGFKEVYTLPEPGVLHIQSVTTVGDKSESTLQVYRKDS